MTSTRASRLRPPEFAARVENPARTVEATVTSDDGSVTATVTPAGELRRLELTERGGRELAATVAATITAARRAAHALAPDPAPLVPVGEAS